MPSGAAIAAPSSGPSHGALNHILAAIETWARDMPPGFLRSTMKYANTKGVQREHPAWQAMTHFFNHQTHHRGQVTTLLSQAGVDVGLTDIIALA